MTISYYVVTMIPLMETNISIFLRFLLTVIRGKWVEGILGISWLFCPCSLWVGGHAECNVKAKFVFLYSFYEKGNIPFCFFFFFHLKCEIRKIPFIINCLFLTSHIWEDSLTELSLFLFSSLTIFLIVSLFWRHFFLLD